MTKIELTLGIDTNTPRPVNGALMKDLGLSGRAIGLALKAWDQALHYRPGIYNESDARRELAQVLVEPQRYFNDETWGPLARVIGETQLREQQARADALVPARPWSVFGRDMIEPGAFGQMEVAMSLPVTVAGAQMPDSHKGYGLPIGGVLATDNAVIPYAVGVDIGCRMQMTLLPEDFTASHDALVAALLRGTVFGPGQGGGLTAHDFADHPLWAQVERKVLNLRDLAISQLGTSGGGNHFAVIGHYSEGGVKRLALLTHSGSRALGARIASHYTSVAKAAHPGLVKQAQDLAWLSLDHEDGQAYWAAMNLAGAYSEANHLEIHRRVLAALGLEQTGLATFGNTHNMAWNEEVQGRPAIVHRKGATPAGLGVTGIIPGTMADPSYVVRGLGNTESLNSSSHGAGRQMGRLQAIRELSKPERREEVEQYLTRAGITRVGVSSGTHGTVSGLDEHPLAYKRIQDVMQAQRELVEIVGEFTPKIVRMADDGSDNHAPDPSMGE